MSFFSALTDTVLGLEQLVDLADLGHFRPTETRMCILLRIGCHYDMTSQHEHATYLQAGLEWIIAAAAPLLGAARLSPVSRQHNQADM